MGIIEIGLTIWAWHRGWRGWSLLPMVIGLGVAFLVGFMLGLSGAFNAGDPDLGIFILIDVIIIGVLVFMIIKSRKKLVIPRYNTFSSPYSITTYLENKPLNVPQQVEISTNTLNYPWANARLLLADGSEIPLPGTGRSIGRSEFASLTSPEYLQFISRQHLWIKHDNGKYFVEDSNSTNGTRINGMPVRGRGLCELKDGDRIDIADVTTLTFKAVTC